MCNPNRQLPAFHVDPYIDWLVAISPDFPARKKEVPVNAFFDDSIEVEHERFEIAVDEEGCKRNEGGSAHAGNRAAKDLRLAAAARDVDERHHVADQGVERRFFALFADRFECVGYGGQFCVSDKGKSAFGAEYVHRFFSFRMQW